MLYYTISQPEEFLAMLLAGAVLGALTLPFALARRLMGAGVWFGLLSDALMGVVWAAATCLAAMLICRGRVRAFHFCAMLSGGALFMAAVSPVMRLCASRAASVCARAFRRVSNTRFCRRLFK